MSCNIARRFAKSPSVWLRGTGRSTKYRPGACAGYNLKTMKIVSCSPVHTPPHSLNGRVQPKLNPGKLNPGRQRKQQRSPLGTLWSLKSRSTPAAALGSANLPPILELLPSTTVAEGAQHARCRPLKASSSRTSVVADDAWRSRCHALKHELLAVCHRAEQELQVKLIAFSMWLTCRLYLLTCV